MGYAKRGSAGGLPAANAAAAPAASASAANLQGKAQDKKGSSGSVWNMQIGGGRQKTDMKRVEVLLFVSELADLLEAGMTLGQALKALANQGEELSAQRYVCQDLCDRIVRGENFSDACAHHPKTFEPLYANMIRAGEALSVWTPGMGGVAEGVLKMAIGNGVGFRFDDGVSLDEIFGYRYGAFVVELADGAPCGGVIGETTDEPAIVRGGAYPRAADRRGARDGLPQAL